MAELQQRLAERRRSADAESAVFNSCDYKEAERPQDAGRHSIGGREALQVQAFRSGWTSTPKFHDWDKPKAAWEAPKLKESILSTVDDIRTAKDTYDSAGVFPKDGQGNRLKIDLGRSEVPSAERAERVLQRSDADAEGISNASSSSTLMMQQDALQAQAVRDAIAEAIALATREAESGKQARTEVQLLQAAAVREQEKQIAQKASLDKVLAFALAEKQKVERLMERAHSDSSQQADQMQKLVASKAVSEKMIAETKQSLTLLQASFETAEAERDAARTEAREVRAERTDLEAMVGNIQEENRRLEAAIADLTQENLALQDVAERSALVEQALIEANAYSAELEQKAAGVPKLEALLEMARSEKARLEKLLSESSEEREAVLAQKTAIEAKFEQVKATNDELQAALGERGMVDQVVQRLEVENVRLNTLAEEAQARTEELLEVVRKTSEENKQLQKDLQESQATSSLWADKAAQSQERNVELEGKIRCITQEHEALKGDVSRGAGEAAAKQAELEQRAAALEGERRNLQKRVQEASQQLAAANASKEEAALLACSKTMALQGQVQSLGDEKQGLLADLEAERQNSARKATEAQMLLEKAHREARLAEEMLEKAHGKLLEEELLERRLLEAESRADSSQALLAGTREMEEAMRMDLQRQLDEAMRENESLQRRIEEEVSRPAASGSPTTSSESPAKATASSAPASAKANIFPELSTTAFGSLLDNWLSVLSNASEGALPTPAPEKTQRVSRPRSPMIGQRGVTKRHLGR